MELNVKVSRFRDAPWFEEHTPIIIGGVGGIGSWLALFLARQSADLYVYDSDSYEEVNMAGQFCKTSDIGKLKTQATKENIYNFTANRNVSCFGLYEEESLVDNIMFSGFDNMKARKLMFENWVTYVGDAPDKREKSTVFIDGRLNAEEAEIYIVTPDKIDEYRKTLFDDSEASPLNCSYKSTTHCSAIIAGLMVSAYNNVVTNHKLNLDYRIVPFSIKYQLPFLNFEIL